jgi:hypothetical protein
MRLCSDPETAAVVSGLPDFDRDAAVEAPFDFRVFFEDLRLRAGRAESFMTNSTGVVSSVARPAGVRLTVR